MSILFSDRLILTRLTLKLNSGKGNVICHQTLRALGYTDQALKIFSESAGLNEKFDNPSAEYTAYQNIIEHQREMGHLEGAEATEKRLADLSEVLKQKELSSGVEAIRFAEFNLATRFVPDIPTEEDKLDFEPLVKALGLILSDPKTNLLLAIALTAPWGGGKSSLMKQLKKYLQDDNRNKNARRWQTIWFDAWKYETNEQVWAILAKIIYDCPQISMKRWQRIKFRFHLERQRGKLGRELFMATITASGGILVALVGRVLTKLTEYFACLATGRALIGIT